MSIISDLMGLGMPAPLAARLGNTPATLTSTGTTQATAATITTHLTIVSGASDAGAIFATGASIGTPFYVTVATGSTYATAKIYCPVSGTMNSGANGSVSLATGKTALFIQTAQSVWFSILTA